MTSLAIGLFILAALIATARLLIGPDLADRIIALDVTLISFMGAITAHAAHAQTTTYLILLIVLAIIGFTATVAAARFLQHEHRGPVRPTSSLERHPS